MGRMIPPPWPSAETLERWAEGLERTVAWNAHDLRAHAAFLRWLAGAEVTRGLAVGRDFSCPAHGCTAVVASFEPDCEHITSADRGYGDHAFLIIPKEPDHE